MPMVVCPTCNKQAEWNQKNPFRPFCSERCKLIDLGAWADGSYAIPAEPAAGGEFIDDSGLEDMPEDE